MKNLATFVISFACISGSFATGCTKPSSGGNDLPAPPSSSSAPTPSASAAPPPPAPAPVHWSGTYTSAPGSLYVSDGGEWKGVHFRGDDASVGLGEGPLTFTLDPKTHQIHGSASGPIGDVILTGAVTGEELSFSVLRKDTTDRGLTGTGVGTVKGDSVLGTMRLSRGDAHVIRQATFSLSHSAPSVAAH